jgi:multidrug efflux pump subunit AcrB
MSDEPTTAPERRADGFFGFVVRRPILFSAFFLAILMGGVFAFFQLQVDLLPTVDLPNVSVIVVNPGMSASDVEQRITRKLERAFSDLGGLEHIRSVSREGVADVLSSSSTASGTSTPPLSRCSGA